MSAHRWPDDRDFLRRAQAILLLAFAYVRRRRAAGRLAWEASAR